MVEDTIVTLNKALSDGSKILIEGANASMLDIDFGNSSVVCLFISITIFIGTSALLKKHQWVNPKTNLKKHLCVYISVVS